MNQWLLILGCLAAFESFKADDSLDHEQSVVEDYIPPKFVPPLVNQDDVHFMDCFSDVNEIGRVWFKSVAKKEGIEENLAMYNGEWLIGSPTDVVLENDFGLIVKTKARHHAIAANLKKSFDFSGKPLIVQYEVKYEEGQECGGGYMKLLSKGAQKAVDNFNDKTPYSIMFGPDKCATSKVHLILKIRNPKNGTVSEHHVKDSGRNLATYFDDKQTHLYSLYINADNEFSVEIDNSKIIAGNLMTDLIPPIEPPKEVFDIQDEKPADWDDREFIDDPQASKPEDWDESQPKEVVDETATKPEDWLEDEEPLIPDPLAVKPSDWDSEIDGEYEPKKIPNPKCLTVSGCGKWRRPMVSNPKYKGKWVHPKVKNPSFKGKWQPRLIPNPNYYEPNPYAQLEPIVALGFELWTMSSGIIFDNILLTDDIEVAQKFTAETFTVKSEFEKKYYASKNPSKGIFRSMIDATEERPWLWAVYTIALLIPTILVSVMCFGRKTTPVADHYKKKTDAVDEDDEHDLQIDQEMTDHEEKIDSSDFTEDKSSAQNLLMEESNDGESNETTDKSTTHSSPTTAQRRRARKE